MKKIINRILSFLFKFKELDPRPLYTFGTETWLETQFRTGNITDYVIKK